MSQPTALPTVRFARTSTRGLLLGFSAPRVAVLGVGATLRSGRCSLGGLAAAAVSGIICVPLIAASFARCAGRPAAEWAAPPPTSSSARLPARREFRARPSKPRPAGTLALPGDAASLRVHLDEASGAAMVHDPHRQTLAAALLVTHPAFALLDDAEPGARVGRWGRVLAGLAPSGTCAAVQVLEATVPDPARGQREWWEAQGLRTRAGLPRSTSALLGPGPPRLLHPPHDGQPFARPAGRRPGRARGRPRDARRRRGAARRHGQLPTPSRRRGCGRAAGSARPSWLPSSATSSTPRRVDPPCDPGTNLAHAGPMAVAECWDRLRHDTACPRCSGYASGPASPSPPTSCTRSCSLRRAQDAVDLSPARSRPTLRCARSAGRRQRQSQIGTESKLRPARRPLGRTRVRGPASPGTLHHLRAH